MVGIVRWKYAITEFVRAHEIGHLFGCSHDDRHAKKPDPFDSNYRYGYFIDHPGGNDLHTIMAWVEVFEPFKAELYQGQDWGILASQCELHSGTNL